MSIGIGLGSFLGGVAGGYQMGSGIRDDFTKRKKQKAIDDVDTNAQKDFAGIKATDPNANWNKFYSETVVPRKIQTLQEQGDMEGADRYQKWADADGVKQGGKLFASGMIKGQNGDMGGAMSDFIAAGKAKGYIDHNYEVTGQSEIKDYDGNITGYKVTIKDGEGKSHEQVFNSADEIMRFGATYFNPDSAYQSWEAGQAAKAKGAADLQGERAKLGLKREDDIERKKLGLNKGAEDPGKVYDDAVKVLSNGADWDTLDDDTKKERIQTYITDRANMIGAQGGAGGGEVAPGLGAAPGGGGAGAAAAPRQGPGRRTIVDQNTGERVAAPAAEEAPAPRSSSGTVPARPEQSADVAPGAAPAGGGFWSTVGANLASGPNGPKTNLATGEQEPGKTLSGALGIQPSNGGAQASEVQGAQRSPEVRGIGAAPGINMQPAQALPKRGGPEFSGMGQAQPLPGGMRSAQPLQAPAGGAAAVPGTMPIRDPELESLRQQLPAQAQRVLDAAARAIRNGVDEKILIPQLQSAGIPAELWPF